MGDNETARLALARSISARTHACSRDELRVIDVVLTRLELGREQYGHLDLSRRRDWQRESAEEIVDERFYRACALLSERDERVAAIEAGLGEVVTATSATIHQPWCHPTVPTPDRPDGGCVCGGWESPIEITIPEHAE